MAFRFDRGAVFAFLLCFSALTIQAHGLGAGSTASALLLSGSILALFSVGRWSDLAFDLCDLAFLLFAGSVSLSLLASGFSEPREGALLFLSLCAYPAARCVGLPLLTKSFVATMIVVVVIGSCETLSALVDQWTHPHGKPIVLGFDAGATIFAMVTAFLVFAIASLSLPVRHTIIAGAALSIPIAIEAASMVRLTLGLILVSLGVMAAFGGKAIRLRSFILIGFVAASMLVGLAARPKMTSVYIQQAIAAAETERPTSSDATCLKIDMDNSIAIRLSLYRDAWRLIGESGWVGIGFREIPNRSCTKNFEVHNSVVQTFVELGPVAGIMLILLIVLPMRSLTALAPISREAAFSLGCLAFIVLISMAHGNISRDFQLFALLGYAASIRSQTFEIAKSWMLRSATV